MQGVTEPWEHAVASSLAPSPAQPHKVRVERKGRGRSTQENYRVSEARGLWSGGEDRPAGNRQLRPLTPDQSPGVVSRLQGLRS